MCVLYHPLFTFANTFEQIGNMATSGTYTSASGYDFTVTLEANDSPALIFGRFGYDWSTQSVAILTRSGTNAFITNLGSQALAVQSISGNVITLHANQQYAVVKIIK